MSKRISKEKAKNDVENFFGNISQKNPKEIKKIKKLLMKHRIGLKEKRKEFCKRCLTPYKNPKIRIKNKFKIVECKQCNYLVRWKIKK